VNATMLILRIIHIFTGVFWAGFAFFNVSFLQPAVRAVGAEGQKTMQHLLQKTRFLRTIYLTATLTVISGLIMYGIWGKAMLSSGFGHSITFGGIFGIIVWLILIFGMRPIFNQMKAVSQQIEAQGTPPTPEQTTEMQALATRLGKNSRLAASLLGLAVLGMAAAKYF
jgi:uncharacterized membrane protein